ncbi:MAG: TIGR04282 family arsenosugar biosynthesis glycosyltransferase [Pseudomonadota bacterium]
MNHLVVMAKAPEAGRVKTRLAREVGAVEATRVYRTILSGTLRRLAPDPRWRTWVSAAPDRAAYGSIWPASVSVVPQGGGNLGNRMQCVFDRMPPGPVIIIGSDIPNIRPQDIAEGFKALGHHDAVIGPAPDGGYWMVGQRRRPKVLSMFADVRWSGPHAMSDTLANLKGVKVALAAQKADLDTRDDYLAWRKL